LPKLSVREYLKGQEADEFQLAQDLYLEIMQNIADIAFALLLDTGLAKSGEKRTLAFWREMGNEAPEQLATRIGSEWLKVLMLPEINNKPNDPVSFIQEHNNFIQTKIQEKFSSAQTNDELHKASVLVMGLALHLSRALGANPADMAGHWVGIAINNGAQQ